MLAISAFVSIIALLLCTRFDLSIASSSNNNRKNSLSIQNDLDVDTLIQDSLEDLSAKITGFQNNDRSCHRPFVTLSYAQSIDGKIALVREENSIQSDSKSTMKMTSSNFAISGPESLRLTHALRSIHDAILVGGKTLSVDNPRLTNRLWPTMIDKEPCVPVILDTNLDHIRLLGNKIRAQSPIICCSTEAYEKARKTSGRGSIPPSIILLPCRTRVVRKNDERKRVLDLRDVLSKLHKEHGINSIMVEGGASVLSLFAGESFDADYGDKDGDDRASCNNTLFDHLCVTISPKLLGANGLNSMSSFGGNFGSSKTGTILGPLRCITLGNDCILFADRLS